MPITSPNNESLKEIRKLAGRKWRDKLRAFVAEGEDLVAAAAAAGGSPELLLAEAGSGLAGEEVARTCSSSTPSSARAPARSRRTRSAGRARPRGRSAWPCGASATRATWAPCCARRSPSARGASRSGPAPPTRTGTRRCAPRWARSSPSPWCAVSNVGDLPGHKVALAARSGSPLSEVRGGDVTFVIGAERRGPPGGRHRLLQRERAHPDRGGVPERRDGGDDRLVRSPGSRGTRARGTTSGGTRTRVARA
jgi:TrmH family RNA methyltransferase